VAKKVHEDVPYDEETVDIAYNAMKQGGRLFYVGAGTSGRIGVLDDVECPPTFSTSYDMVQAVIAGGGGAFQKAVEGAEDNPYLGEEDLKERDLSKLDVVIGIAASGRTPYVLGAMKYAQELGAKTISLTSNEHSEISKYADVKIEVVTGPEVLTGSTRMKAATAHKMILKERDLSKLDVVIGIAASGRTPYVLGAMKYAQELGAKTISLTSNEHSEISKYADVKIEVVTGPEVLTGSTRMKAATAHKMIL